MILSPVDDPKVPTLKHLGSEQHSILAILSDTVIRRRLYPTTNIVMSGSREGSERCMAESVLSHYAN